MFFIYFFKNQILCCFALSQLLAEIEEHLGCTIAKVDEEFKIEVNEFDSKVVYGQKRANNSVFNYENHVGELSEMVGYLSQLEKHAQIQFLSIASMKKIKVWASRLYLILYLQYITKHKSIMQSLNHFCTVKIRAVTIIQLSISIAIIIVKLSITYRYIVNKCAYNYLIIYLC